jgi:hypothetical protein
MHQSLKLVYRWNVVVAVLLVVVRPFVVNPHNRTDHDQQHCYNHISTVNQR